MQKWWISCSNKLIHMLIRVGVVSGENWTGESILKLIWSPGSKKMKATNRIPAPMMCPWARLILLPSSSSCVASGVAPKSDSGPNSEIKPYWQRAINHWFSSLRLLAIGSDWESGCGNQIHCHIWLWLVFLAPNQLDKNATLFMNYCLSFPLMWPPIVWGKGPKRDPKGGQKVPNSEKGVQPIEGAQLRLKVSRTWKGQNCAMT